MTRIRTLAGTLVLAIALGAAAPARADQAPQPLPSINVTRHQVVGLVPRPPAQLGDKDPGTAGLGILVGLAVLWLAKHLHG